MKTFRQGFLMFIGLVFFVMNAFLQSVNAQQPNTNPPNYNPRPNVSPESQQMRDIERRESALRDLERGSARVISTRRLAAETLGELSPEVATAKRMMLAPEKYYEKYASFLKSDKAGITRLFQDKDCNNTRSRTVPVEEIERCAGLPPVAGGGSWFSFNFRSGAYGVKELQFTNGKFKVGDKYIQSILTNIGDVDLEDVDFKSKAMEFLKNYEFKTKLSEINEQKQILEKGISAEGFTFSDSANVELNHTYVLRSVMYRRKERRNPYAEDTGIDLYVAFKVVGREKDDSIIILWKELRREYPTKELQLDK